MNVGPCYFRPGTYLYNIKPHQGYYFCVGASKTLQALWGLIGETVYLVLFSPAGEIENVAAIGGNAFFQSPHIETHAVLLQAASKRFIGQYGLESVKISVKRFWLENINVGIEDVSDSLKEMIQSPETFDAEELADCSESLELWKAEEQYVFWWEQTYYMTKEGDVTTS
jgi:hypothetical protein